LCSLEFKAGEIFSIEERELTNCMQSPRWAAARNSIGLPLPRTHDSNRRQTYCRHVCGGLRLSPDGNAGIESNNTDPNEQS
jgi:hypothetical protein